MKLYFETSNFPWAPERYHYSAEQMMLTLFPVLDENRIKVFHI